MLTFGSGFSGIDGLGLGLEWAGWVCKWQVEKDPYAIAVLAERWPNLPRYGDIRSTPLEELEPVDAVVGGFPCQPTSVAGNRLGKADDRWLFDD
jgi:DNA (cytosine-5)-methyltransferase 1